MKINKYILISLVALLAFGGASCTKKTGGTTNNKVVNTTESSDYLKITVSISEQTSHEKGKTSKFKAIAESKNGSIKSYEWKVFAHNGTNYDKTPIGTGTGIDFSQFFSKKGDYKVSLKVTDNLNEFRTATLTANVSENLDNSPNSSHIKIKINHKANAHQVNKVSRFSASVDVGSTTSVASYKWKVYHKKNGKFELLTSENSDTEVNLDFKFTQEGEHKIALKVTDANGEYRTEAINITVRENSENSPNADEITISFKSPSSYSVDIEAKWSVKGSTSKNGNIENYEWNLYKDSDLESPISYNTSTDSHNYTFRYEGVFFLKVKVIDSLGNFKTHIEKLTVGPKGSTNDPHNQILVKIVEPEKIKINREVTFDSNGTTGPNPLDYKWKLEKWTQANKFEEVDLSSIATQNTTFAYTFRKYDETYRISLKVSANSNQIYRSAVKEFKVADIYPPEITQKSLSGVCSGKKVVLKNHCAIALESDEDMKISTINSSNVRLVRAETGIAVNIVLLNITNRSFSVQLDEDLEKNANYHLIIQNIEDGKGNKGEQKLRYTSVDLTNMPNIVYVKDIGTNTGNGNGWNSAYNSLDKAVAKADSTNPKGVIFVAGGTYTENTVGKKAVLTLKSDIQIYGGFDPASRGTNAEDRNIDFANRDTKKYLTKIDSRKIDGKSFAKTIIANNVTGALLDGFTISGLKTGANQSASLWAINSNFTINNCIFTKNISTGSSSAEQTSGIYISNGGMSQSQSGKDFVISNSEFLNNDSKYEGAAIRAEDADLKIIASRFFGNSAQKGGAVYLSGCDTFIDRTSFYDNKALSGSALGGAINLESGGTLKIANSSFAANVANNNGSAISATLKDLTVINSTFAKNSINSTDPDKACIQADIQNGASISNSLFWENKSANDFDGYNSLLVKTTMMKKMQNNTNNNAGVIVPPATAPIGKWNSAKGYFPLSENSPAKNKGTNDVFQQLNYFNSVTVKDQLGNKRVVNDIVDLGAIEEQ